MRRDVNYEAGRAMARDLVEACRPPRVPFWQRWFPVTARPFRVDDPRSWIATTVHVRVSWQDRLRLLATGRAEVLVTTYTDVPVVTAQSLSSFAVLPWGTPDREDPARRLSRGERGNEALHPDVSEDDQAGRDSRLHRTTKGDLNRP